MRPNLNDFMWVTSGWSTRKDKKTGVETRKPNAPIRYEHPAFRPNIITMDIRAWETLVTLATQLGDHADCQCGAAQLVAHIDRTTAQSREWRKELAAEFGTGKAQPTEAQAAKRLLITPAQLIAAEKAASKGKGKTKKA